MFVLACNLTFIDWVLHLVLKVILTKCNTVIKSRTLLIFLALDCRMKSWWRSGKCRFVKTCFPNRCRGWTFAETFRHWKLLLCCLLICKVLSCNEFGSYDQCLCAIWIGLDWITLDLISPDHYIANLSEHLLPCANKSVMKRKSHQKYDH